MPLPTAKEHTSLNLALAVGIVLYTLFQGRGVHIKERGPVLAERTSAELLKARLKDTLARIATSEAAALEIQASVERIFTRAPIESRDARAWHKILRALDGGKHPRELGVDATARDARRTKALRAHHAKTRSPGSNPEPG